MREIECFIAAAEELSFTRAAEKLHLAQPPLSRHIQSLEEKIGGPLFRREGRRVSLTPTGALFYDETRALLPQLARAGEAARRHASGEVARLRLGFVSAVLSPELLEVLRRFRAEHPAVQLSVYDQPPAEQLAAIARGTLDGGFVGLRPLEETPGVQCLPWMKERVACFVPAGHRLARSRELAMRELAQEAFVAVSSESAPAFAAFVRRLCRDAGFRPRVVVESARAQAVAVMVAAGLGVAVLPESLKRVVGHAVAVVPLAKAPTLTHVFARRAGPPTRAMKDFVACLSRVES